MDKGRSKTSCLQGHVPSSSGLRPFTTSSFGTPLAWSIGGTLRLGFCDLDANKLELIYDPTALITNDLSDICEQYTKRVAIDVSS
jgi:hypothetical protein